MKIFKINKEIEIVCTSENTRSGFRHLGTLLINGVEQNKGKCTYQNRTWEKYDFQSVLFEVIRKSKLSEELKKECNDWIEEGKVTLLKECNDWIEEGKKPLSEIDQHFKTISTIAKIGEIFADTQKDKNDWKLRMLKAGLTGLSIPNDWETLSETEKETRLNKVIEFAQSTKEFQQVQK